LRGIEELMAERGVNVSYETIRRWIDSFGPIFANRIKSRYQYPSPRWHLDEVYAKINGKIVYLWRAVDEKALLILANACWLCQLNWSRRYFSLGLNTSGCR